MVKKFYKILFVLLLIFTFFIGFVSASDININLPSGNDTSVDNTSINNTSDNNNNNNNNDAVIDNNQQNIIDNQVTSDENSEIANTQIDDSTNISAETLQPSTLSKNSEGVLSVTNIINILLGTIGFVLILLGIAILIKLKN